MKIFTVLYPDKEDYTPDAISVMIDLSPSHIDMIKQAQDAAKQLKGVIDIVLNLSKTERPKITFLEERFNERWAKYESMFAKVSGDLPETYVSISVSYIDSYRHIKERFVYESAYDVFKPIVDKPADSHEYIIGNNFYENYLQDADNLLELKKYVCKQDFEFLVKESGISDEELQEDTGNMRRQYEG
jgi:hypothetical protein